MGINGDKNLIIVGTRALSEMVYEISKSIGFNVIGYIDDFTQESSEEKKIIGSVDYLLEEKELFGANVFVAIGDNISREKVVKRLGINFNFPNLIHPQASLAASVNLVGGNNLIFPFAYLGVSVVLGSGNIVFSGARINHHNNVGDYNFFAPNASVGGYTSIGNFNKIGMNSVLSPYLSINNNLNIPPLTLK